MKQVLVLLVLLIGAYAYDAHHSHPKHECVHDKKMKNHKIQVAVHDSSPLPFTTTHASKKMSALRPLQRSHKLQYERIRSNQIHRESDGVEWVELRIKFGFDWVNEYLASRPSLQASFEISSKQLQSVRNYFENILQVRNYQIPSIRPLKCDDLTIPEMTMEGYNLYVAVQPESDEGSSYFAAAIPCAFSSRDLRPIIGNFIINFAFIKVEVLQQFLYFSVFAHEFTHILGFSQNLFYLYIDPNTIQQLQSVTSVIKIRSRDNPELAEDFNVITLKQVVDYARNYFSCGSLEGLPLENNGADGSINSHWEKLFLPTEYMNPTIENPGRISEFTLNLLRGTGWYQVDSSGAQNYDWNKGAGCGHFSICPTGRGYCQKSEANQKACSTDHTAKVETTNKGNLHN